MRYLVFILLCCATVLSGAEALIPSSGTNSTTLIIYSAKRRPFTLENDLERLKALLSRVATRLSEVPLEKVDPESLSQPDYLIVFSPDPNATFSETVRTNLAARQKPVLWVGNAAPGLTKTNWKFADIPGNDPIQFGEMLLSFYGVQEVPSGQFFLRIEDYGCNSNHRELRRMGDFLFARGISFGVVLTGMCDLDSAKELVETLRYVQTRGARLILKTSEPLWDTTLDRAATNLSVAKIKETVANYVGNLNKYELHPVAWENGDAAAPDELLGELARLFPVAIGSVQLSDATARDQFMAHTLTRDRHGMFVVPNNIGFVSAADNVDQIKDGVAKMLRARGAVAGCAFHAYLPFWKLTAVVDELEQLHVSFLDLNTLANNGAR